MNLNKIFEIPFYVDFETSYPHSSSRAYQIHDMLDCGVVPKIPLAERLLDMMSEKNGSGLNPRLSLEGTNMRPAGMIDYAAMYALAGHVTQGNKAELVKKHIEVAFQIALMTIGEETDGVKRKVGPLGNPVFTAQYLVPAAFLALSVSKEKALFILYAAIRTKTRAVLPAILAGSRHSAAFLPLLLLGPLFMFRRVLSFCWFGIKRLLGVNKKQIKWDIDNNRVIFAKAAKQGIRENPLGIGLNNFGYILRRHGEVEKLRKEQWNDRVHNEWLEMELAIGCDGFDLWRRYHLTAIKSSKDKNVKAALAAYLAFIRYSVATPCGMSTEALLVGLCYEGLERVWQPYAEDMKSKAENRYQKAKNTYALQSCLMKKDFTNAKMCADKPFDTGCELKIPKELIGNAVWLIDAIERESVIDGTPSAEEWARRNKCAMI